MCSLNVLNEMNIQNMDDFYITKTTLNVNKSSLNKFKERSSILK